MPPPSGRARSGRTRRASPRRPPASGESFEVTIERIGARGDGIAEGPRGRLYIPLTVPGDRVRVRTAPSRGAGHAAAMVELLSPGPGRAAPPCPHFARCGGCSLQHLTDESYRDWKLARLTTALTRVSLHGYELLPLARTPQHGRRRARFAAFRPADAARKAVVGFKVRQRHEIVDLARCGVLGLPMVEILPPLRSLLGDVLEPGQRAGVIVTSLESGLDVVVEWPAGPGLAQRERLAAFAEAADLARLSWRPSAVAPAEPIVQRRPAGARFGGLFVALPPGGFLQPSKAGEAALVTAVREAVGAAGRGDDGNLSRVDLRVADLFAGSGTFTFPLAQAGARVHAVDDDGASVAALAATARGASALASAVSWDTRDLFRRPLTAAELDRFDAVVLDPPRAGARAQSEELARARVPVIAAVSCNPETFARDARILVDGGYRLERVTPVDQFLWSPHLELVGVFRR